MSKVLRAKKISWIRVYEGFAENAHADTTGVKVPNANRVLFLKQERKRQKIWKF